MQRLLLVLYTSYRTTQKTADSPLVLFERELCDSRTKSILYNVWGQVIKNEHKSWRPREVGNYRNFGDLVHKRMSWIQRTIYFCRQQRQILKIEGCKFPRAMFGGGWTKAAFIVGISASMTSNRLRCSHQILIPWQFSLLSLYCQWYPKTNWWNQFSSFISFDQYRATHLSEAYQQVFKPDLMIWWQMKLSCQC